MCALQALSLFAIIRICTRVRVRPACVPTASYPTYLHAFPDLRVIHSGLTHAGQTCTWTLFGLQEKDPNALRLRDDKPPYNTHPYVPILNSYSYPYNT